MLNYLLLPKQCRGNVWKITMSTHLYDVFESFIWDNVIIATYLTAICDSLFSRTNIE